MALAMVGCYTGAMPRAKTGSVAWKSHRWQVRITDAAHVRRWIDLEIDAPNTPAGKLRAQAAAANLARDIRGLVLTKRPASAPKGQTLAELAESWYRLLDECKTRLSTRDTLVCAMKNHLLPVFGGMSASEISTPKLRAFFRDKSKTGKPASVKSMAGALARFFKDAMAEGWVSLPSNPMRDPAVRESIPSVPLPDVEDIVTLPLPHVQALTEAATIPLERRTLYLVGATAGLRTGELFGLQWSDLALQAPIPCMRITKQLSLQHKDVPCMLVPLKTKNCKRTLPLHPYAIECLKALGPHEPTDFVFGHGTRSARFSAVLREDLQALGHPSEGFSLTTLRHTFATLLEAAEVGASVSDRLMGHSASSTRLRHYAAPSLERMQEAVARLPFPSTHRGNPVPPERNGSPGKVPVLPPESGTLSDCATKTDAESGTSILQSSLVYDNVGILTTKQAIPTQAHDIAHSGRQGKHKTILVQSPSNIGLDCSVSNVVGRIAPIGTNDAPPPDTIEVALAEALRDCAAAGQWELAAMIATQLATRRGVR